MNSPPWLTSAIFVAIGGGVGSVARVVLGGIFQRAGSGFPLGTLGVNLIGSFVLGGLTPLLAAPTVPSAWRLALTAGLCGGFTTFSTFSYETAMLLERGQAMRAATYVTVSLVGSLAALSAGLVLARAILDAQR